MTPTHRFRLKAGSADHLALRMAHVNRTTASIRCGKFSGILMLNETFDPRDEKHVQIELHAREANTKSKRSSMKPNLLMNARSGMVHKVDAEGRSLESCNIDAVPKKFRVRIKSVKEGKKLCRRCFPAK